LTKYGVGWQNNYGYHNEMNVGNLVRFSGGND